MQNHLDRSGLVLKLNQLQVPEQMIDQLAEDALLQTRLLQNNPRELHLDDAKNIYTAIYA